MQKDPEEIERKLKNTKVQVLFSQNQEIVNDEPIEMSLESLIDHARASLVRAVAEMLLQGIDRDEIISQIGAEIYSSEEQDKLFQEARQEIKAAKAAKAILLPGYSYFYPNEQNPTLFTCNCGCRILYFCFTLESAKQFKPRDEMQFSIRPILLGNLMELAVYNNASITGLKFENGVILTYPNMLDEYL